MKRKGSASVRLADGHVLVGLADGRSWVLSATRGSPIALPVSKIASLGNSLVTSLLEGSVAAGLSLAPNGPRREIVTLERYVSWLAGNAVFARETPRVFRRAAERFVAGGRHDLATLAMQKAKEESGHSDLAVQDLKALGLTSDRDRVSATPPSAFVFVQEFEALSACEEPVQVFGFSYCLERLALLRDENFRSGVRGILPIGIRADRFLSVHSALGLDARHVMDLLGRFESLPIADVQPIALAAFRTACLVAAQPSLDFGAHVERCVIAD